MLLKPDFGAPQRANLVMAFLLTLLPSAGILLGSRSLILLSVHPSYLYQAPPVG